MDSGADVLGSNVVTFKRSKEHDNRRLRDGFKKFREALEEDAKVLARRESGLPKDWRTRILR